MFPPKETLTGAGDGDGGGQQITTNLEKQSKTTCFFYICFPRKGTLTNAMDGGEIPKISTKQKIFIFCILYFYFVCFHILYFYIFYMFCIICIFCIFVHSFLDVLCFGSG